MKKTLKTLVTGLMAISCLITQNANGVTWTFTLETSGVNLAEPHEGVPAENAKWSALQLGREIAGEDDWRGFNRAMFAIQEAAMDYVATPLDHVYCSLVPKPLIRSIDNAINNSEYPIRLVATLLRGEGGCAWDETKRFAANTVLGLGGLFDPARDWFGIFSTDASLSGTFATWGIPRGPSLVLPFVPRVHVRDCAGYILDQGLDPKTYVNFFFPTGIGIGWTAALWPNDLAMAIDPWNANVKSSADPYEAYRRAIAAKTLLDEKLAVYHYMNELAANEEGMRRPPVCKPPSRPAGLKGRWQDLAGYGPRAPAIDSLRVRLFAPARDNDSWWMRSSIFNGDFAKDVATRTVALDPGRPDARYGFVPAPAHAVPQQCRRLVFVIPGIGGEFDSASALAMAELVHDAGASAVTIDNPFNWRYAKSANHGILPGNLPEDARRLAAFMRAVIDDLSRDGLVDDAEVSVVGWSMGGLFVSHLAELESRGELGFTADTLLAVNPPVDFNYVISTVESFIEPAKSWSREQMLEKFVDVTPRLLVWDKLRFDSTPDVSEEDARFTVATFLVAAIPELVTCVTGEESADSPRDYLARFPKDSARHVGMKTIEGALRANAHVSVIHTWDDFLLNDGDRDFLDNALGDRITWFSAGAHCGMFHTPEFKREVLARLKLSAE